MRSVLFKANTRDVTGKIFSAAALRAMASDRPDLVFDEATEELCMHIPDAELERAAAAHPSVGRSVVPVLPVRKPSIAPEPYPVFEDGLIVPPGSVDPVVRAFVERAQRRPKLPCAACGVLHWGISNVTTPWSDPVRIGDRSIAAQCVHAFCGNCGHIVSFLVE